MQVRPSPAAPRAETAGEAPRAPVQPGAPPATAGPDVQRIPISGLVGPIDTGPTAAQLNSQIMSRISPPPAPEDLPLGPGDLVEVSVFEVPELSNLKMRVPLTGQVSFPLLGPLQGAGRTPAELQEDIRQRLQHRYMHDPQVSVFVLDQKSHRISVVGAVKKSGPIIYTGPIRLADALAMAEGLSENADHFVYLTRRGPAGAPAEQAMTTIDLEDLARGNDNLNLPLQAGDVVLVPAAGSFYVGGQVEKAGTYPLRSRTTIEQAIITAGGLKNVADWSDVRVYRTGPDGRPQMTQHDLNAIAAGASPPEVQKNDVVLVGRDPGKTAFFGLVDFVKSIFNIGVGVSRGF